MRQLQGLIFDLEGTLLDSSPAVHRALTKVLEAHDRRVLTLEEVQSMMSDGIMALIERAFLATGGLPGDDLYPLVQEHIRNFRTLHPEPDQIYPYVTDTLKTYSKAGVKLGICTNKSEGSTIPTLKDLGLDSYFSFIAGGDTFEVHKPNPNHVLGVVAGMNVPLEGCVFVGDGPNDVAAAHGAKIPCILVTHGTNDNWEALGGDALITDFRDLPEALKKLDFSA